MSLTVLALIPLSTDAVFNAMGMGASALQDTERSTPFARRGIFTRAPSSVLIESARQTRFWWNGHVRHDVRTCAETHSPELYITYV